jgi:hypothetical protein
MVVYYDDIITDNNLPSGWFLLALPQILLNFIGVNHVNPSSPAVQVMSHAGAIDRGEHCQSVQIASQICGGPGRGNAMHRCHESL